MSEQKNNPIRVLLIDDSPLVLTTLKKILQRNPEFEVVATAANGFEGLEMTKQYSPDVITADYHMPGLNGLEMTRRIMAEVPTPILVLSVSVLGPKNGSENIFQITGVPTFNQINSIGY